MQAASGWAPLSHAARFAPVCICGSNGCASACGMGFAVDKGHAFKSARTAVLSPSRQAAVGPPGRRVLSLAAPSPSCQVVASLSSRCSAGRRAARPYYKGRLCSQNAPFDEIAWIRLGHSGLARRASCKTPGQSRALEPCEKEGALHPYYLGVTCISPAQTDEIVWISGRRAACAGNQGCLLGRSRLISSSWAACGPEAVCNLGFAARFVYSVEPRWVSDAAHVWGRMIGCLFNNEPKGPS